MKCRVCGNDVAPGMKYCDKCGTGLGGVNVANTETVGGDIAWNTRDFPKPKQPKEIKMQWGESAISNMQQAQAMQQAPVQPVQPVMPVQQAPVQPAMSTWQMPAQQQVNIPPAYNVQPHNVFVQPAPQPTPLVVPQSAYQSAPAAVYAQQNLQNTNPNLTPVQTAYQPDPIQQLFQTAPQQPVYQNLQNTNPGMAPVQAAYQPDPIQQLFQTAPQQPVYQNLQNTNPGMAPVQPVYQSAPAPQLQPTFSQPQPAPVFQQSTAMYQPAPVQQTQPAFSQPQPAPIFQQPAPAPQPQPVFPQPAAKEPEYEGLFEEEGSQGDDSRFYTFTSKNKEFQRLLDEEYSKYYSRYGEAPAPAPKPEKHMDETKLFFPGFSQAEPQPAFSQPQPAFPQQAQPAPQPAFPQHQAKPSYSEEELFTSREVVAHIAPQPAFPEVFSAEYEESKHEPEKNQVQPSFNPADKRTVSKEQLKIEIAQKHMQLAAKEAEPDVAKHSSHQDRLEQMAKARAAYFDAMESLRATGEYTNEELDSVDIKREKRSRRSESETQPDEPVHAASEDADASPSADIALAVALGEEIKKPEIIKKPIPETALESIIQGFDISESEPKSEPEQVKAAEPAPAVKKPAETIKFDWNAEPETVKVEVTTEVAAEVLQSEPAIEETVQPEPVIEETVKPEPIAEEAVQPEPAINETAEIEAAAEENPIEEAPTEEAPVEEAAEEAPVEEPAEDVQPEETEVAEAEPSEEPAKEETTPIILTEGEAAKALSLSLAALIEKLEADEKEEETEPEVQPETSETKEEVQPESEPEETEAEDQTEPEEAAEEVQLEVEEDAEEVQPEVAEEPQAAPKKKNYFDFLDDFQVSMEKAVTPKETQSELRIEETETGSDKIANELSAFIAAEIFKPAAVKQAEAEAEVIEAEPVEELTEPETAAEAEQIEEVAEIEPIEETTEPEPVEEAAEPEPTESAAEPEAEETPEETQPEPEPVEETIEPEPTESAAEPETKPEAPVHIPSIDEIFAMQAEEEKAEKAVEAELALEAAKIVKLQGSLFDFKDIENLQFDSEVETENKQEEAPLDFNKDVPEYDPAIDATNSVFRPAEIIEDEQPSENQAASEYETEESSEPEEISEKPSKQQRSDKVNRADRAAIRNLKKSEKAAVKTARKELKSADRRYTKATGHSEGRGFFATFIITLVWVIVLAFAADAIFTTFFPDTVLAEFFGELNQGLYPLLQSAFTAVKEFFQNIFS